MIVVLKSGGVGVVMGMVMSMVRYWWWWWSTGGCDCLCKGSSCNSCRSDIVKYMLHGGQDKSHQNHYYHHHQY